MKIGQLVFFLKKKKIYKIQEIEQIVINRSDRIGDATLTRPLIDILVHYLREN